MPEIIEGEAIRIDDGRRDPQPIMPSWLEPLPESYKAKRAWIALGISILVSIFFAYLSWKYFLSNQLLSPRGVLTLLGVMVSPAIGFNRWRFWKSHPEVRRYAKVTSDGLNESHDLSYWWSRLRSNPLYELTPEAQAEFQFYEGERRAEFRQRWQNRISWIVKMARARTIRFPIAILILLVDFALRYKHQITIVEMGSISLVAVLVAYEMSILLLIYLPLFFLISRFIPYTTLVPVSVAFFMGAMVLSMAIKAELKD